MLPLLNAQHAVNRNNIEIMWQFYLLSYFCLVKWFSILYQTHFCTDWLIDWCLAPTLASISAISWRKQLYCCLIINHKHISTVNVFNAYPQITIFFLSIVILKSLLLVDFFQYPVCRLREDIVSDFGQFISK